jgi:superfamily II DNA or RNA helicase
MSALNITDFEDQLLSRILSKGRQLYSDNRITNVEEFVKGSWEARVKAEDSSHYDLYVNVSDSGEIRYAECSCHPKDFFCEHIVALLFFIRDSQKRQAAKGMTEVAGLVAEPSMVSSIAPTSLSGRKYDQLNDIQRSIVLFLAFFRAGVPKYVLEERMRQLGHRLSPNAVASALSELAQLGLVQSRANAFECPPEVSRDLIYHCGWTDRMSPSIIALIRQHHQGYYLWSVEELHARAVREIFMSMIEKDYTLFLRQLNSYFDYFSFSEEGVRRFSSLWLPEVFDRAVVDLIPKEMLALLLDTRAAAKLCLFALKQDDAYQEYVRQHFNHFPDSSKPVLARQLCVEAILRRDAEQFDKWLRYLPQLERLAATATEMLLRGKISEAFVLFTDIVREQKKHATKQTKVEFYPFYQFFYLLLGLSQSESSQYGKWIKLAEQGLRSNGFYNAAINQVVAMGTYLSNENTKIERQPNTYSWEEYWGNFVNYWTSEPEGSTARLSDFRQHLEAHGFHWLSRQLSSVDSAATQPASQDVWVFRQLFKRTESWENVLEHLFSLSVKAQSSATRQHEMRLIWLVDFDNMSLQPKEQSHGKSGWLSGRNVGQQRLISGKLAFMTEQDRRIAAQYVRSLEDWSSLSPATNQKLWEELVGHPYLFLMKSPGVAVQFEAATPRIFVRSLNGGHELAIDPWLDKERFLIQKETATRYKLYLAQEYHEQLNKLLPKGRMFVPDRGEKKLQQALEGLSRLVDVDMSQLSGDYEQLHTIPAENKICIHLLPVGDGFHLEMYVKPFGNQPPYLQPGQGEEEVIALVDGQRTRTKRSLRQELVNQQHVLDSVETLRDIAPEMGVWSLEDAHTCLNLLAELNPLLQAEEIVLEWPKGEKLRVERVAGFSDFSVRINARNDWFEVEGELRVDEQHVISIQELLALSQQNKSDFIELSPGKFLALTEAFRKRLEEIEGFLSVDAQGLLQMHPLSASAMMPLLDTLENVTFDQAFKERREMFLQAFNTHYELPAGLEANLRPYQQEGFEWLSRCAAAGVGACLADDMGLGKTVQALGLLLSRASEGAALVVAPASVCRNWLAETHRFAPSLKPILFGEGDREAVIEQASAGDLIIVTYDLMTRAAQDFAAKTFSTIILDEAQSIKNRNTKRSETAMQLKGTFKVIMTGTPLENHLGELWNLFQFINPGLLGSLEQYNDRFAWPIERLKDIKRREQLKNLLHPFILRRRKDDVLKDLPPKTEIVLTVERSDEEVAFYEALRRSAVAKLSSQDELGGGEKHLRILAEIMRLRRAACHPRLADPNTNIRQSGKMRMFADLIVELKESNHKALVFSQFVGHLELLREVLEKHDIHYQYLDGQTPLNLRQRRIEAFQRGEGDCFLISLKAGGVGLNLTAADYVIHMDPWWNPAVEDQATDRAHRIGQEKPVTVYRLVAEGTIEEKILKLHDQKRDLADSLLSGADISTRLTADELLAMITDSVTVD